MPAIIPLQDTSEPLFKPPKTLALKSGHVVLKKGESSGRHTTDSREEILIIRSGKATLEIDGQKPQTIEKNSCVYIPPKTWHNVKNEFPESLDYIYITAPT